MDQHTKISNSLDRVSTSPQWQEITILHYVAIFSRKGSEEANRILQNQQKMQNVADSVKMKYNEMFCKTFFAELCM